MLLSDLLDRYQSRAVGVDDLPPNITERACVSDRFVLEWIPPILTCGFVSLQIVLAENILVVTNRLAVKVHVYEDPITESYESTRVNVTVDLGVFGESCVNDMLSTELGSISIESVGEEYRDVVTPRISRCRR